MKYLKSKRNLSNKIIDNFELGFAPNSWNDLFNYLSKVEKFPINLILASGLAISKDNSDKIYDRFRNRLIVPIHDMQGRVVAFGGRALDGQEPKYLNSPESEIFEKGKMLFAFEKASSNIRKKDKAIIVEGYFDVIALHSNGITNSVASLGTALNKYQISQLCRCTDNKNIILNFDSDNAGILATKRVIKEVESLSLHDQINLKILQLNDFKDPDEFLNSHTREDYFNLIDNSSFWIDWEIDQIFKDKDLTKSENFQSVISSLVKLLSKLPQSSIRTHYLQKVSERLSKGQARLAIQFEQDLRNQVKGFRWHGRSKKFEQPNEISRREKNESEIIFYYLHCPDLRLFIREEFLKREINGFNTNYIHNLWETISKIEQNNLVLNYLNDLRNKKVLIKVKTSELSQEIKFIQDNLFNYKTQLEEIEDILKYSIIKSPIAGYVYEINAKDKGFVIGANQDILKIVPQENLEALVFVNSKDIGFILTGQEVELNIDSYPAADFGGVDGIISFISANSRKINDRDNNLFYEVKVSLNNQLIELNSGKNLPLKPGMSLSANIKLRRLSYLQLLFNLFTDKSRSIQQL